MPTCLSFEPKQAHEKKASLHDPTVLAIDSQLHDRTPSMFSWTAGCCEASDASNRIKP